MFHYFNRDSSSRDCAPTADSEVADDLHSTTTGGVSTLTGNTSTKATRCSELQYEWITQHPAYIAIKKGKTILDYVSHNPIWLNTSDPTLLIPCVMPSMKSLCKPLLIDYVQLPTRLWVPDFYYPHHVKYGMPCCNNHCTGVGTRQRWSSHGPRVIHNINSAEYLYYWEYKCTTCDTRYSGVDNRVLAKLPISIQAQFTYFLTDEEGVTTDLLHWIQRARVSGSSLKALRQCMVEARYDRLHTTIVKYYQHCKEHKAYVMAGIAKLLNFGVGTEESYDILAPVYPCSVTHSMGIL